MESLTFATTKGVLLVQQKDRHDLATYFDIYFERKRGKDLIAFLRVSFPQNLIEVTVLFGESTPRKIYDDLFCAIGAIAEALKVEILDYPGCFDA